MTAWNGTLHMKQYSIAAEVFPGFFAAAVSLVAMSGIIYIPFRIGSMLMARSIHARPSQVTTFVIFCSVTIIVGSAMALETMRELAGVH